MLLLLKNRESVAVAVAAEGKSKTYRQYPAGTGPVEVSYGTVEPIRHDDRATGGLRLRGYGVEAWSRHPILGGTGVESWHVRPPATVYADAGTGRFTLSGSGTRTTTYADAGTGMFPLNDDAAIVTRAAVTAERTRHAAELAALRDETDDDLAALIALL